jgi:hypothetical protein
MEGFEIIKAARTGCFKNGFSNVFGRSINAISGQK